ncbi:MAG: hypothetical protein ACRC1M_08635 [Methanobacteriaceae archaeon]
MLNQNNKEFWIERQKFLKKHELYCNDCKIDGIPGNETKKAIKKFQTAAKQWGNYPYTIDNDWGNETEKAYQKMKNLESLIKNIDVSNSVDYVSKDIFKSMINQVTKNPSTSRVYINTTGYLRKYVNLTQYKVMKKRYDDFIVSDKVEPNLVYINKPNQLVPTTNYLAKFSDAVGRSVKNWEDVCIGIKNRVYKYYYDDIYAQENALNRLKNRTGLNCTDICQLIYQALKDLGYEVRYRHIMCSTGGHIQLEFRGKDAGSNWIKIDPSNSLDNGSSCKTLWCPYTAQLIRYDSCFLLKDNGKGGACV